MNVSDRMTRRQVANFLDLHPDSVSRALHDGLATAVVAWGGRGKPMLFSRVMIMRWKNAKECQRNNGRRCIECHATMDDIESMTEHLMAVRHGIFENCGDEDYDYPGRIGQPCRQFGKIPNPARFPMAR